MAFRRKNKVVLASSAVLGAAFLIVLAGLKPLLQKEKFITSNIRLGVAVDVDDIKVSDAPLSVLTPLSPSVVSYAVLDVDEEKEIEAQVRKAGLAVLWRSDPMNEELFAAFSGRLRSGDGVLPSEEGAFGYPGYLRKIAMALRETNSFAAFVEFLDNKGLGILHSSGVPLIKTHVLHLEEVLYPKPDLWTARLVRAARDRAVRLLVIRLSPLHDFSAQREFLTGVSERLNEGGFSVGKVSLERMEWPIQMPSLLRTFMALFFSTAGPVAAVVLGVAFFPRRVWGSYLVVVTGAIMIGLVVHIFSFQPASLYGLAEIRGVKLMLLGPFALGAALLFSWGRWRVILEEPVRVRHVALGFLLLGLGGGLYLMRSGNHPLIPVSDGERHLRDSLEIFFGARPRFKEFIVGYPALLAGLALRSRRLDYSEASHLENALLVIGLLGPISVINTFCHLHSPVGAGLLRSFHGAWLGALFFGAGSWVFRRFLESRR